MEGKTLPPVTPSSGSKWKLKRRLPKKLFIFGIPLLSILLLSAVIWFFGANTTVKEEEQKPVVAKEKPPTQLEHLITGVKVSPELYNRHPVAVMIENSTAARPQAGLTSADVVYEAVTEGGITRFMGVFSTTLPTKAGPVRSARSYFIDYLSEYDAFYAHAGGSPTALERIKQYGIKDYSHSSDAYWREPRKGVASEHTLFTDVSKIFNFGVSKKGWSATADFKPWLFKEPSPVQAAAATVTINFSSTQFNTVWTFNPANSSYVRAMAGLPHKDAVSGEQITVSTLMAISVPHSANAPYKGTGKESEWTMTTIGEGNAALFEDGVFTPARWKKPSRTERLRLYDATTGAELSLNRGKMWIAVVPQEGSYGQQ